MRGRQGIALRGDEDSGKFTFFDPVKNDGNFRTLLRFRMKDDPIMKDIFERSAGNAQYCSPRIQNELIDICGQLITEKIVDQDKSANCYTILADETTDISRQEQMALGLQFVYSETLQIREEFIEFAVVEDLTGESLGQFILSRIEKLGLDMKLCRGQGYDGAPNMNGHLSGAQAFISSKYPLGKYVHCIAHSLNLVLTDSSKIAEIKHCTMVIREAVNFFLKRSAILKTYIALNLKGLCETRWVERHDAIQISKQLIVPIFKALEEIETDGDSVTFSKARSLLNKILSLNYIVTLIVMDFFLGYTLIYLSKLLQSKNIDMLCAFSASKV
ncbi:52 kDa repressor of the inhibitor of the protein kinase-like [Artemia franciscana]|uniref:52 kDa repressor of the inhibitor of the protein kinase-like n=1 Tax=Artemia franciscana TaxID=6661 RepID=UPI0032D9C07C